MRKIQILTRLFIVVVFSLLILANTGCKKKEAAVTSDVTDYAIPGHWLALPSNPDKPVDVFYLYPTVWAPDSATNTLYCSIDNPSMLVGSVSAFNRQATAFETAGNLFAPYYRQANAARTLVLNEDQRWEIIREVPAVDITAAFDYYIRHYNNGRPFIIVGHSQGANVMLFLLSEYMTANPAVYSRMVAAYVIGYPVTAEFMAANKHLKYAEGPDDTGVIISFNTQSPKVVPGTNIVVANNIGLVINPINWKRDETLAPASESLGSYMPDSTKINFHKVLDLADARLDVAHGVLICSSVNDSAMFELSGGMGLGVYHAFDIPFYYYNLRENAERRANKFFGNSKSKGSISQY
ncbi:MAG: DUF3089 domain-containing protein [Bacteroidota bacterium]